MSVFKLPLGLCADIKKGIARFWWNSKEEHRSIQWARREKMCTSKGRGGMGFRDLTSFNQTLVAKQGWRLIQFPDSLVAKVLKVLQQGLRWRIGSGEQVKIYSSNWIPRPSTFKTISAPTLPIDAKVSMLINEEHKWNEALIRQHFKSEDADCILKIMLPRFSRPDRLLWAYDKHGKYSVKSGYQVALRLKLPDYPSSSKANPSEWHAIWKLDLPEKVKIFMWRAAQNTAEKLWNRKVLQQPWCQRCSEQGENASHALLNCKESQKTWRNREFSDCAQLFVNQDLLSVIQIVAGKKSKAEMELLIALCWANWHSRNLFVFEGKKEDSQVSLAKAEAIVESYWKIKSPPLTSSISQSCKKKLELETSSNRVVQSKCDAATKFKEHVAGLGVVIRNSEGNFVAAQKQVKYYGDVTAIKLGIEVAEATNCVPLIIESDCQVAVDLAIGRKSGNT